MMLLLPMTLRSCLLVVAVGRGCKCRGQRPLFSSIAEGGAAYVLLLLSSTTGKLSPSSVFIFLFFVISLRTLETCWGCSHGKLTCCSAVVGALEQRDHARHCRNKPDQLAHRRVRWRTCHCRDRMCSCWDAWSPPWTDRQQFRPRPEVGDPRNSWSICCRSPRCVRARTATQAAWSRQTTTATR